MKEYAIFGAGNIGFGVIEKLALDAKVTVFDIRKPDYLTALMKKNANITFNEVDAADEESIQKALSSNPFDIAILTVGISSKNSAFEDFEAFKKTICINFLGNIVPMRALVKSKLVKEKIIVLASTSGHFAGITTNAYAPSKWMLVNACNSIRGELEEQGISLDLINPRTIKNERSSEFKSDGGITVSDVVDVILNAIGGGTSRDYFIPKRYRLFHIIERLSPWIFDMAAHMPPHIIRKRGYKDVRGTALITGASSGLGRELVKLYANQCDQIYITARSIDALDSLKNELIDICKIIPIQVDFENANAVETVKAAIGEHKINLLINNAGHHVSKSILDVELETIKKTMEINFFNPVGLIAAFSDADTIVNILSTTAVSGRRNLGVYSSTKAGLWCFSKALRRTTGKALNVVDVIPATFKSSLASKGEHSDKGESVDRGNSKLSSSNDGLDSATVAKIIKYGIDKKRDTIYIPRLKTKLFIVLEALAPKTFKRIFK